MGNYAAFFDHHFPFFANFIMIREENAYYPYLKAFQFYVLLFGSPVEHCLYYGCSSFCFHGFLHPILSGTFDASSTFFTDFCYGHHYSFSASIAACVIACFITTESANFLFLSACLPFQPFISDTIYCYLLYMK